MRRVVSIIVCVFMASFYAGLSAQIPESAQFQPGSYAVPYRAYQPPVAANAVQAVKEVDGEEADNSETDWERQFSPQITVSMPEEAPAPQPYVVPHLTYVYNHWTGRFHLTPYEPGYAANPSAFPKQTSPLHIWVSSKSAVSQPSPQVPYMSYYDPDPVILPAEIRLRGSRFSGALTQLQPMPMPVPKPETAQPVVPSRTRLGERIRQNFGTFIVP
jgi:hypothetical protein